LSGLLCVLIFVEMLSHHISGWKGLYLKNNGVCAHTRSIAAVSVILLLLALSAGCHRLMLGGFPKWQMGIVT